MSKVARLGCAFLFVISLAATPSASRFNCDGWTWFDDTGACECPTEWSFYVFFEDEVDACSNYSELFKWDCAEYVCDSECNEWHYAAAIDCDDNGTDSWLNVRCASLPCIE